MPDNPRLLQWRNLPMELRLKKQWVVASPNKAPLFLRDNQFYNASVSKHASSQWMSFEDATTAAITHSLQIGFIIAEGDGITCIDLDVKPNTTKETMDLFQTIVKRFDSYTERSIGGHGIHIWCKGDIGLGRRRDGVEIYSQNRFMICTGNVLHLKEHLEPRQEMLTNMVTQMPLSADYSEIILEDLPQVRTDEEIGRDLWEIDDGRMLWQGSWQDLGHPSQSEADLDIMVHLCRLSPSNQQVYRLFRQSNLGKRNKANRKDYVDRTMRHARFIRQQELVDIEMGKKIADAILAKYDAEHPTPQPISQGSAAFAQAPEATPHKNPEPEPEPQQEREPQLELDLRQYEFPPGGLGYLARHFYKGSFHPNILFSTTMAITVMSAICGRAWNTNTHAGLNTYNLIIAPSGMGKEDLSKGIMRLIDSCKKHPTFDRFFYFGRFTAGISLIKHFGIGLKQPTGMSFVQIATEFSDIIGKMATGRDENIQQLMMTMLDLHGKASRGSKSSAMSYSDATKNVISLDAPAYSILGETTPEVYERLSDSLLSNGFLSRFNIWEYQGQRPARNENPDFSIDPGLVDYLILFAKISEDNARGKAPIVAELSPAVQKLEKEFHSYCDRNYNLSVMQKSSNVEHNLWSRSPVRVNVLATLAAIMDNPPSHGSTVTPPIVTEEHWNWAEGVVRRDINDFKAKQEAGDVGSGDVTCVKKIETWLDEYVTDGKLSKKYPTVKPEMQAAGKIPLSYIRQRSKLISCFKDDRKQFSYRKVVDAVQTLVDIGSLKEIKDPMQKMGVSGKFYQILTG